MQIKEITDKAQWENFIISQKPNTFLHSWAWGEFNLAMGGSAGQANETGKIFRLGIFSGEKLIGAALIIKISAKRGKFLFCPHGPIIESSKFKVQSSKFWNHLFDYLKDLAIKERVDFIRISPLLKSTPENLEIFRKYGFRDAPIHMMHPELSWLLDISRSEADILKGMRKTTRNLIRRAERQGVKVNQSSDARDISKFYDIHRCTVERHGFVPFSEKYLEKELAVFRPKNGISIFFAEHDGRPLSSAIIVFYGDSAFYHHAASLASKIPASYLLVWEAAKAAKKRGCKIFNFWGIAPDNKPNHPWAGLTLFKKGFGGYEESYLHAHDFAVKNAYFINWLVESFRRRQRGY